MGDVADMMLGGTLCAGCGCGLYPEDVVAVGAPDGDTMSFESAPGGIPVYCDSCSTDKD